MEYNKMILKTIFTAFITLFLTACSFKSSTNTLELQSTQANNCQKLNSRDDKLLCYDKIKETNSYAQLRLGIYFFEKKEYEKALELLNQANKNKNPYSNLPLAYSYFQGKGNEKNLKKAFKLLKQSASVDPTASYQLSRFYFKGIQTEKDLQKGLSLLEFAANNNVKIAQEQLYTIYSKGKFGIKKDSVKAAYWDKLRKDNQKDINYKVYAL